MVCDVHWSMDTCSRQRLLVIKFRVYQYLLRRVACVEFHLNSKLQSGPASNFFHKQLLSMQFYLWTYRISQLSASCKPSCLGILIKCHKQFACHSLGKWPTDARRHVTHKCRYIVEENRETRRTGNIFLIATGLKYGMRLDSPDGHVNSLIVRRCPFVHCAGATVNCQRLQLTYLNLEIKVQPIRVSLSPDTPLSILHSNYFWPMLPSIW